jgi:nitronate monooxygenase
MGHARVITAWRRATHRVPETKSLKATQPDSAWVAFDVLPLVEGGKGVAVSNGATCGGWAAGGGVGTFSAVNADSATMPKATPDTARPIRGRTRRERHEELVAYGDRRRHRPGEGSRMNAPTASGKHPIHNERAVGDGRGGTRGCAACWKGAKGLIHGITCGAGMPYRLAEIAVTTACMVLPHRLLGARLPPPCGSAPIPSSPGQWLGGVVYEDPWLAGGHNGLSNSEDPKKPEDPYPRVREAAPA